MSTTTITRAEVKAGDKIRVEYAGIEPGGYYDFQRTLSREFFAREDEDTLGQQSGETLTLLHRPVTLPTEPGIYADRVGDHWRVDNSGKLTYLPRSDMNIVVDPEQWAPFTRLVPEVKPDTALVGKLEQILDDITSGDGLARTKDVARARRDLRAIIAALPEVSK